MVSLAKAVGPRTCSDGTILSVEEREMKWLTPYTQIYIQSVFAVEGRKNPSIRSTTNELQKSLRIVTAQGKS